MSLKRFLADTDDEAKDSPFLSLWLAAQLTGHDVLGEITGRDTLYHGTSKDRAAEILDKGLGLSAKPGIAEMLDEELRPAAAYTTPNKIMATNYANQTAGIEDKLRYRDKSYQSEQDVIKQYARSRGGAPAPHENAEVLQASVPTWKMKTMPNPETAGGLGAMRERIVLSPETESALSKFVAKNLAAPAAYYHGTRDKVFSEPVPSKYFRESPNFEGLSLGELGQYLKTKPLRALGGVARGAAGVYAGTAAVRGIYDLLTGDGNEP